MRKLWVFLLAVPVFALGAFLAVAYQGATGSLAGFRIACEVLNAGESTGLMTKAQRADVVERAIKRLRPATSKLDDPATRMLEQFKTGCPELPNL
jgi:hypothetical protein